MNAILGQVDNESLVNAHLQFEQLLMSMFMKSMNEQIQKALDKSTVGIEKRIAHKIANAILGVIEEKTSADTPVTASSSQPSVEETNNKEPSKKTPGIVRIFELPAEEQKRYTTIADSKRIAKTFVLRECGCLSEANHLLGCYLRKHDTAKGYTHVRSAYGLQAMYDRRSVNWLCRGYANKTLSPEMLSALSYYFE